MARLTWAFSSRAAADYRSIAAFSVERFGPAVTDAYLAGLEGACDLLTEFPEMAPLQVGVNPPARCLVHRSHRIFYRVRASRILILRILHHAQATPPAL